MIVIAKHDHFHLKGDVYIVYAVYTSAESAVKYAIGDPYGTFVSLYNGEDYVVVSDDIPSEWVTHDNDGVVVQSFPEWDDNFLYWLQEGREAEVAIFNGYRERYTAAYQAELLTAKRQTLEDRYREARALALEKGYQLPEEPDLAKVTYP